MNNGKLYIKKSIPVHAVQMTEPFEVKTLEGPMQGKAGDYLITGVKGEQYPCDKHIFETSYIALDSLTEPQSIIGAVPLSAFQEESEK